MKEKAYRNSCRKSLGLSIVFISMAFVSAKNIYNVGTSCDNDYSIAEVYLPGSRLAVDSLTKDPEEVSGCKFSLVKTHQGPT